MSLESLNAAQREAALYVKGPLLIIAGAGAGKTKTITERIIHLIKEGVSPNQILAVTFTNKAATEMKERVQKLLDADRGLVDDFSGQPFIATFHRLGIYVLRTYGHSIGLTKYFNIMDRDDSISLIKKIEKTLGFDPKQNEPRKILGKISHYKGLGITFADFEGEALKHPFGQVVAPIWRAYEEEKTRSQSLDFDDLLLKTVLLLKSHPTVLEALQNQFHYIHIDEYQDTNRIQYELANLLAAKHHNLCVVGDVDQSIYSWRGADFENLMRFEDDYPQAKVVLLEQNYRSTNVILEAANAIIEKNQRRKEKNLFTDKTGGEAITLYTAFNEADEARFVAEKIRDAIRGGLPASKIAVLFRANFQSRSLEEALLKHSISYQVVGVRFFERKEVKDLLAFIKFAINNQDFESLARAAAASPRGIGKTTIAKIAAADTSVYNGKKGEEVKKFMMVFENIRETIKTLKPSLAVKEILHTSGLEQYYKTGSEEDTERLENLRELVSLSSKYDHLSGEEGIWEMITEATLASDQDNIDNTDRAKLLTVHAAKGLEFDIVFVTGLEQGLFPHEGFPGEDRDDEEERRLFYVAITRAATKLYLSYAQIRTLYGNKSISTPSEFLLDIPDHLVFSENGSHFGDDEQVIEYLDF